MLSRPEFRPALPASDLDRARGFYEGVLGLQPLRVEEQGVTYEGAGGTTLFVFPSSGKASGTHTQMSFGVEDVEAEVSQLTSRGVEMEVVDMPGADPTTRIVTMDGLHIAWFRDTEGNLLAISDVRNV